MLSLRFSANTRQTKKALPKSGREKYASQFSLGARQLAGDARVVPAGGIHGAGKRLEQRLDDVMRFVAVKQFQVQIAAGFVGEALEKFAREAETKRARDVLIFFRVAMFFCENLSSPRQTRCGRPPKSMTQRARHSSIGT